MKTYIFSISGRGLRKSPDLIDNSKKILKIFAHLRPVFEERTDKPCEPIHFQQRSSLGRNILVQQISLKYFKSVYTSIAHNNSRKTDFHKMIQNMILI